MNSAQHYSRKEECRCFLILPDLPAAYSVCRQYHRRGCSFPPVYALIIKLEAGFKSSLFVLCFQKIKKKFIYGYFFELRAERSIEKRGRRIDAAAARQCAP